MLCDDTIDEVGDNGVDGKEQEHDDGVCDIAGCLGLAHPAASATSTAVSTPASSNSLEK